MNERDATDTPPVPPHLFSVVGSAKSAFGFIADEWRYLARLAAPVIFLQIGFSVGYALFKDWRGTPHNNFEFYLWDLPGSIMMGWFICSLARMIVFGEKLTNLPLRDIRFMQYRAELTRSSIFLSLLIQAVIVVLMTALGSMMDSLETLSKAEGTESVPGYMSGLIIFMLVMIFWSARFLVTPLLVAVDYPIGTFLRQARGFLFSLRLIGLTILCAFPVLFVFNLIFALLIPDPQHMTDIQLMMVMALNKPAYLVASALINAGYVFALIEMLGRNKQI
ncbi:MAG: hypothetical protein EP349_04395 [Alphaproteobacteria bacterium]|nr:MAG: hypothetical protein EP349_04395 [Alphaproteobacteria bacterium]